MSIVSPLATAWHSNKFLNPATDGAVLPILHLNGYKISNPTIFSRISHDEIRKFFEGCGWKPYFVEGDDPKTMHKLMAETLDTVIEEIKAIQKAAREDGVKERPMWPMIVFRSPKGWTGPKVVDGKQLLVGYYLDLFKQQNMLKVYEKNIEQTKQVLKELQAKGSEGIVLKNDITRYELLLSNLELTHTQIQNTITILNNHLTTTLGLSNNIMLTPDTTILSRVLPINNEESWITTTITSSPTLRQASLAVQMSKYQDKIIRSERIPKLALFAGNKFDGPIIIEVPPINKNFNYWYVGVGLKYNISSLYKTNKAVSRSKFSIQRNVEQYEDTKEQIELAVKADHIKYLETYVELNTQQKSVELANQNYTVIRDRYKNDMALITDMLDASNSKLTAEVQLVNAQINIIYNYYKLLYISGTL